MPYKIGAYNIINKKTIYIITITKAFNQTQQNKRGQLININLLAEEMIFSLFQLRLIITTF